MLTKKNITYLKVIALLFVFFFAASCGRNKTKERLLNKKWEVYDVTPPEGAFDIQDANRAKDLKNGFYKNAWFKFLPDSVFIAAFHGNPDTGKYVINFTGKTIALYPKGGNKMYEQIQIQKLTDDTFSFNTVVADFHLTLHLRSSGQ